MKNKSLKTFILGSLFCFLALKCFSQLSGPYLGQTSPGIKPVPFASGIIPSSDIYGISFSPDGRECFYGYWPNIMITKETNGQWINPKAASFSGNTDDMEPQLAPNGRRIFFGSYRALPGTSSSNLYTWYADKTETGWSDAKLMDPPLRSVTMMNPSAANNGNLYFTASPESPTNHWISVSKYIDGKYQEPERLSDSVNFKLSAHPFIAPDESYIIFDVFERAVGEDYYSDMYICFKKPDGSWTRAINLGNDINTSENEICAFVSRDNKYFFFSRNGAIYWMDASFIEKLRPVTGVKDKTGSLPSNFRLYQNYPNPFNPSTTIALEIPKLAYISLGIYNILGRLVKTLINDQREPGSYSVIWDGKDDSGNKVSTGLYILRLNCENFCLTNAMIFLK